MKTSLNPLQHQSRQIRALLVQSLLNIHGGTAHSDSPFTLKPNVRV